jgi:hypothetical protein
MSDEPEAGRELDALVAERLFGFTVEKRGEFYRYYNEALCAEYGGRWTSPVPEYSTHIGAAWEVVERMLQLGWEYDIGYSSDFDTPQHEVTFDKGTFGASSQAVWDIAPTVQLAISRAALKAVESEAARTT